MKELWFHASLGKKVFEIPLQWEKKLGVVVCTCYPGDGHKFKIGGSQSRTARVKSKTLAPK
jgi:hypothetical protein